MRTYEDFAVGHTGSLGQKLVVADEVVAFALEFDPQPFHLDVQAGKASLLGGLAASGWHTSAMLMRMIYDAFLHETAGLGSPGIDEVKWLKLCWLAICSRADTRCTRRAFRNRGQVWGYCGSITNSKTSGTNR